MIGILNSVNMSKLLIMRYLRHNMYICFNSPIISKEAYSNTFLFVHTDREQNELHWVLLFRFVMSMMSLLYKFRKSHR